MPLNGLQTKSKTGSGNLAIMTFGCTSKTTKLVVLTCCHLPETTGRTCYRPTAGTTSSKSAECCAKSTTCAFPLPESLPKGLPSLTTTNRFRSLRRTSNARTVCSSDPNPSRSVVPNAGKRCWPFSTCYSCLGSLPSSWSSSTTAFRTWRLTLRCLTFSWTTSLTSLGPSRCAKSREWSSCLFGSSSSSFTNTGSFYSGDSSRFPAPFSSWDASPCSSLHWVSQVRDSFYILDFLFRSVEISQLWLVVHQKTKATLSSPTSRDLSDSTVRSPLNSTRKKLQRPKLWKSQTASWKWRFSPDDFLGLQQSLCNITFLLGIFISKIERKKYHGDGITNWKVRFWWPLFKSNFCTVEVIFLLM